MSLKNRLLGGLAAPVLGALPRAGRVARAELGCTAVAPIVLFPATRDVTRRLSAMLRRRKRIGDTWRGRVGGRDVSVVNTGVGTPSAEGKVIAALGVGGRVFLRVDICGGLGDDLAVGDVVVAEAAVPYDGLSRALGGDAAIPASPLLLRTATEAAAGARRPIRCRAGVVATVDTFHHQTPAAQRSWAEAASAVDMETSIIYLLARRAAAHALAIMAVSDLPLAGLDPFGEGRFPYGAFLQGLDDVTALAEEIIRRLPEHLPALA